MPAPERLREMLNDTPETRAEMSPERSLEEMLREVEKSAKLVIENSVSRGLGSAQVDAYRRARRHFDAQVNPAYALELIAAVRAALSPKQGGTKRDRRSSKASSQRSRQCMG